MGEVHDPRRVTPIVAMLARQPEWFEAAKAPLETLFGPVELESPLFAFDKTAYYTASMGPNLQRRFFTFRALADPAGLVDWKLAANRLELELKTALVVRPNSNEGLKGVKQPATGLLHTLQLSSVGPLAATGAPIPERPINLDPGYLTGAKLVLASTKDFAHRIYLRDGIFAEITMGFRGDSWTSHDFTFPDFRSGVYDTFLKKARDRHLRKRRGVRG